MKDLDPPAERFRPIRIEHSRLRIYALAGPRVLLAWCRDTRNTWQTELAEGRQPDELREQSVVLAQGILPERFTRVRIYDPWTDTWSQGKVVDGRLSLPTFSRSLVFRIEQDAARK